MLSRGCALQVPLRERALYKAQLSRELGKHGLPLLGVAPFNPLISSVRMDEIQAALSVGIVSGRKHQTDLTVNQVCVTRPGADTQPVSFRSCSCHTVGCSEDCPVCS